MKHILFTFTFLILSQVVLCQTDKITDIRRLYQETVANKSTYKKLTQDDFEHSSEGGEITVYRNSKEIRLIEATYYGHMGQSQSEYYYLDDQVYFIFQRNYIYNSPPTDSSYDSDKTKTEESRFYFWDNQMIRWITPEGQQVKTESIEFLKESIDKVSWAKELIEIVK